MESNVVSVIVPVYNAEKYIKECVQSVLSQTYKDWELIFWLMMVVLIVLELSAINLHK